jgi:CubicO group peptidase (beta-lactamase class C family)
LLLTACASVPERAPDPIGDIARGEIEAGHVPGAVILVGAHGRIIYRKAFGLACVEPQVLAMRADAVFDLASLTKVVVTTTAIMQLVEAGAIHLDDPVARYWSEFAASGKAAITVRQLLTHTSGLRPDIDTTARWSGAHGALAWIAADRPVVQPGSRFLYSDVNFIVLGELVQRASGESLDAYAKEHIFAPLGMSDATFDPAPAERARIVPTDRQGGVLRWGEVQDPTANRMGGIAGHAGLFASADDLAKFANMILHGGASANAGVLRPETVAEMTRANSLPGGVRRGLGWDVGSPYAAGMNTLFGPNAFGHTGYTGTLLWLDPDRDAFLIVLTSRLYPDDRGDAKPLRARVARAALAMLEGHS